MSGRERPLTTESGGSWSAAATAGIDPLHAFKLTRDPAPRPSSPAWLRSGRRRESRNLYPHCNQRRAKLASMTVDLATSETTLYTRRLSNKVLIAFDHACDQGDVELAEQLLHVLEMTLNRWPLTPDGTRRRNIDSLVAAHEWLWQVRRPTPDARSDTTKVRSSGRPNECLRTRAVQSMRSGCAESVWHSTWPDVGDDWSGPCSSPLPHPSIRLGLGMGSTPLSPLA
jgi:hypothetical protein